MEIAFEKQSIPVWLSEAFKDLQKSKEWKAFIEEIYNAVDNQLTENHVENFADLSQHQKSFFVNKALKTLEKSISHQVINEKINWTLGESITLEANKELRLHQNPFQTRSEYLLYAYSQGIKGILNRWPVVRERLKILFNQRLPDYLRPHIWRAFLMDDEAKVRYAKVFAANPKSAISPLDKEISRRFEQMLNTDEILARMKGSVGCFYALKAIVSYWHSTVKNERKPQTADFLLALPLAYVLSDQIPRHEPCALSVLQILVEEYFAVRRLHSTITGLSAKSSESVSDEMEDDQLKILSRHVYLNLVHIDSNRAEQLMTAFVPTDHENNPEAVKDQVASDAFIDMIRALSSSLLVGYVNMETLQFVWDQLIIGSADNAGFYEAFWPNVLAIFLHLTFGFLTATPEGDKEELSINNTKVFGRKLQPSDFQYLIAKHFYSDLLPLIGQNPLAPTLGYAQEKNLPSAESNQAHWKEWLDSIHLAPPISAISRTNYRFLREEERRRLKDLETDNRLLRQQIDTANLSKDQEKSELTKKSTLQKAQDDQEKRELLGKLNMESRLRKEDKEKFQKEINDLNEEIDRLKILSFSSVPFPSQDARAAGDGINTPQSDYIMRVPPQSPSEENQQAAAQQAQLDASLDKAGYAEKSKSAIQQYLVSCGQAANKVANGSGDENFALNDQTVKLLTIFNADKNDSEILLFGHPLKPGELEEKDRLNGGYPSQKLNREMYRRNEERRKQ